MYSVILANGVACINESRISVWRSGKYSNEDGSDVVVFESEYRTCVLSSRTTANAGSDDSHGGLASTSNMCWLSFQEAGWRPA